MAVDLHGSCAHHLQNQTPALKNMISATGRSGFTQRTESRTSAAARAPRTGWIRTGLGNLRLRSFKFLAWGTVSMRTHERGKQQPLPPQRTEGAENSAFLRPFSVSQDKSNSEGKGCLRHNRKAKCKVGSQDMLTAKTPNPGRGWKAGR